MYEPRCGVMSWLWTNHCDGSVEPRSVDQTWTVPVDRPPVTVKLALWVAVASRVSRMVL